MTRKILRPYQSQLLAGVRDVLAAGGAPLGVLPTGGGKTATFARLISEWKGGIVAIAHRKELVAQISSALASEGLTHRVIAPRATIRAIAAANAALYGYPFISPSSSKVVASVDALKEDEALIKHTTLIVFDESHHPLKGNKWGKAVDMFPRAVVAGFTATPERTDGMGLGAKSDGFFTDIVSGPSMRDLMDMGSLCPYRLFAPESAKLDLSDVSVSKKTGDFNKNELRTATKSAQITGDVVSHYKKLAMGKLGLTFVADVEAAIEMAEAYNAAGVPAAAVSAKTPPAERAAAIKKFAQRKLLQLVNVDLFGEGFDLSNAAGMNVCVEVVSMVRPTQSYVVYSQQFGRALRLGKDKEFAIIIDHVGNTIRHGGPPDFPRVQTLDARVKKGKGKSEDMPLVRACQGCTGIYERELASCPYCGLMWKPSERGSPDMVDGDLVELDPSVLAELRSAAGRAVWTDEQAREHYGRMRIPTPAVAANVKRNRLTREAQEELRDRIAEVAGEWRAAGADDGTIHRRFYLKFGIDIVSACALKCTDARLLMEKMK